MNRIPTGTYFDSSRKIWSGPKVKQMYSDEMTIGEVVLCNLSRIPDKVIQVDDVTGEELTAGEILRVSKLIARNLQRRGLNIGDVVGICADKSKYISSLIMASLLCGSPFNALYPDFDKNTIKILFQLTNPKIVFCDVQNYKTVQQAMADLNPEVNIFLLNGKLDGVHNIEELLNDKNSDDDWKEFPCSKLNGDDTAVILCSSGTTSTPKATYCSHKSLINPHTFNFLSHDSVLSTFSPLFWISAVLTILISLTNGLKHVITNKAFSPEYLLEIVEKHKVTDMISGPQHIAEVMELSCDTIGKRLSSIRSIICGGSTLHQSIAERFHSVLNPKMDGLCVGYGMTELSGVISVNTITYKLEGSVGKLKPNIEVRIVGPSGDLMGVNESGVLHVHTGYTDGWFNTSDIGHFDEDGYLHFEDRQSNAFKSHGLFVFPNKIEDVIMRIPGVLETCVFGVPDIMTFNLVACAIVRSNSIEGRQLTESRIIEEVANNFADYCHLNGGVFFVDSLPKTSTGKLQRRSVPEWIKKEVKDNEER